MTCEDIKTNKNTSKSLTEQTKVNGNGPQKLTRETVNGGNNIISEYN